MACAGRVVVVEVHAEPERLCTLDKRVEFARVVVEPFDHQVSERGLFASAMGQSRKLVMQGREETIEGWSERDGALSHRIGSAVH